MELLGYSILLVANLDAHAAWWSTFRRLGKHLMSMALKEWEEIPRLRSNNPNLSSRRVQATLKVQRVVIVKATKKDMIQIRE